jgi:hypothetical protein
MEKKITNQDGAEESLAMGAFYLQNNNQEGKPFVIAGLKWFEDNKIELSTGNCYVAGIALSNIKKGGSEERDPKWQDKGIELMERVAADTEWLKALEEHKGSIAVEIFHKLLEASKGEQKYRNELIKMHDSMKEAFTPR